MFDLEKQFIDKINEYKKDLSINRESFLQELKQINHDFSHEINGLIKYENNFDPHDDISEEFFKALEEYKSMLETQ